MTHPTKYKPIMCERIVEIFSKGQDVAHFCSRYDIAESTFYLWVTKHPEFKEAYHVARQKAKQWYLDIAQNHLIEEHEGAKLNTRLWSMLMRNRFELTEHRKLKVERMQQAKNAGEQMQAILDEIKDGNLTGQEAALLAKVVETSANIEEKTELVKRVEQIERAHKEGYSDDEFKEESSDKDVD